MPIFLNHTPKAVEVVVDGPLTIMEAAEAHGMLALAMSTSKGSLQVDLSQVTELDSAGLQLLLALVRSAGQPHLLNPAIPVLRTVRYLNLEETFGLKEIDHGL